MEYDVFISCKSEDYELAEEVYQYLKDNDIHAFLSTKELRRMKEAEYMDAISEALDKSYHLIVLASTKENVTSKWVKFEWTTFLNEMLSGRKKGQMVTFLKDVKVEELPIQLRHYETFTLDDYKDRLVHYVETPAYQERRKEALSRAKEEEIKRNAQLAEEQRKETIKKEIEGKEADYRRFSSTLEDVSRQIIEKRKQLGESKKVCPVCGKENLIENVFCDKCGWSFVTLFDANTECYKDHLFVAKSIWNDLMKLSKSGDEKLAEIKKQIIDKEGWINKLTVEKQKLEKEKLELDSSVHILKCELEDSKKERDDFNVVINELKLDIEQRDKQIYVSHTQYEGLKQEFDAYKKQVEKKSNGLLLKIKNIYIWVTVALIALIVFLMLI